MLYPFTDDQKEFRSHIARWVDERVVPVADEWDRRNEFMRELFQELGELGVEVREKLVRVIESM